MTEIRATYRIVTPMFIGGADHEPSDGVRPPSFKGALRFWWRALNWGRIRNACGNDADALRRLHEEEAALFGAAAKTVNGEQRGGQGKFLLSVASREIATGKPSQKNAWHTYFLGQGLWHFRDGYSRDAVLSGEIEAVLRFRPGVSPMLVASVTQALVCLGMLGGLGSRSRKGFGSLALQSLDVDRDEDQIAWLKAPKNRDEMKAMLARMLGDGIADMPPFTAFSSKSRVDFLSMAKKGAWESLEVAAKAMQLFRSYGRMDSNGVHRVNGMEAEQNFKSDHDRMLDVVKGNRPDRLPDRAVFGLPHNYFFSSLMNALKEQYVEEGKNEKQAAFWARKKSTLEIAPSCRGRTRRASPLLIHVHRFPDGSHALVQSFLPARFLARREKVEFKGERIGRALVDGSEVDFGKIHEYMNRFENAETIYPGAGR